MRVKITVTGIVQGVGFRPFIYRIAAKNGLTGYVLNRGDAGVEVLLEGQHASIDNFLHNLQEQKPPQARIYSIKKTILPGQKEYSNFAIIRSSSVTEHAGSVVPPDIAICNDCLKELRNPADPRYEYFFITCTNCGPRFTIIEKLPYDRENTTMKDFPLCGFCQKEYDDPINRRFHAQTIACPTCGPKAYLVNSIGKLIESSDPVRKAGKLISEGKIIAIKGYGGFHIASSATKENALKRLRASKQRHAKPFALMARNLDAIRSFAEVNQKEQDLLVSPARPVVLLNKNIKFNLSSQVAPDLHNIGVMLPYSAMHYMIFDQIPDLAFVMTSANPANQPIIKDNQEALQLLGNTVDFFLFHNRKIAQRCDDSVMRVHENHSVFIRRSRGYAPAPIKLKQKAKHCVLALGGELNNTICILNGDKAFISQHIGDIENIETRSFLQNATDNLKHLTNTHINAIACDLHPNFVTSILAQELAEQNNMPLIQVQHHHAHIAALMAEHNLSEIVGIACDGYGYGFDGSAWGGEVLLCTHDSSSFKRVGHLESQPLLGGDVSTRYPLRIAASILNKKTNIDSWLIHNSRYLPHGETEAHLILMQLKKANCIPQTTSLGRIFDAASAILGVCYERTYEGEAAMKLESCAEEGEDVLDLPIIMCGDVLDTSLMIREVYENRDKFPVADLAYSVHSYLGKGLANLAVSNAQEQGIHAIGLSGGAAVNKLLATVMREVVESYGLQFFVHESVPAGDGGVSFGQAVVGAFDKF